MKKTLFLLSCAAGLTMASCSQNKTDETAATDGTTSTSTTTTSTATSTSYSDDAIQRRADRISNDMATQMKLDDATRAKVRTVYLTRGQRLGELEQKYATDTMGRAAAMRDVYTSSDAEMKSVFTDPTQYSAYESSRSTYMDNNYMNDDDAMASDMNTTSGSESSSSMSSSSSASTMDNSGSAEGVGLSKMKAKAEDGSKIKVKDNGKVKTKDADGEKTKM